MKPPHLATVAGLAELLEYYRVPPNGVRANMIFSADGAAAFAGRAGPLSEPVDQAMVRELRGFADAVLVGAGTARAEGYGPVRVATGQGGRPLARIAVVSNSGALPETMFADSAQRPILVTTARAAKDHALTTDKRREVVLAGEENVDFADLLAQFRARGMKRILCEGGPTLLDELTAADLIDELCVTIAPRLAGVQTVGLGGGALATPRTLHLNHVLAHSDYLYLKYSRSRM